MTKELKALSAIVLKSVFSSDDVWSDEVVNVDGLHARTVREIQDSYDRLRGGIPSDNIVVQGMPGAGKTHLLGQLRRHVVGLGDVFVYFQLNSADQIWQGLVLAYLESLLRPNNSGNTQAAMLVKGIASRLDDENARLLTEIADGAIQDKRVLPIVRREIGKLFGATPRAREAADVALALMLYASHDCELQNIGSSFLICAELTPDDRLQRHIVGLTHASLDARQIVRALDRIVSEAGRVSVLTIDQLDGLIATACHVHDRDGEDAALLDQIATTLMDVSELTNRTLIVVSSLVASWHKIENAVPSASQRYPNHLQIGLLPSPEVGREIVELHLAKGFARGGFTPPYASWPVKSSAFSTANHHTPRQLITIVDAHVKECRRSRQIIELESLTRTSEAAAAQPETQKPSFPSDRIKSEFEAARASVDVAGILDERSVDTNLPALLREGLAAWVDENVDRTRYQIDPEFGKAATLHARLRQLVDPHNEEERHWSFRAVLNQNSNAALTRLRAAIIQSAISMGTKRRRLVVIRNASWSTGSKTREVVKSFEKLGGQCLPLSIEDLKIFAAIRALRQTHGELLVPWLKHERPASKTALFSAVFSEVPASVETTGGHPKEQQAPKRLDEPAGQQREPAQPAKLCAASAPSISNDPIPMIRLGQGLDGCGDAILKLEDLRRHVAIFAGSGSGKTVLIRRLVEECALQGVSSIVLDPNNDLSRLGSAWPTPPLGWSRGDASLAGQYRANTEVIIWTPRRATGRPLTFKPLGDLRELRDDADELAVAVDSAVGTLFQRAGMPSTGGKQEQARAVLKEALLQFVANNGEGLKSFLEYLSDLPPGTSRLANGEKLAHDLAQTLIAATVNDPMFGGDGAPAEPGILLTPSAGKKARISVISLVGLPNDDQRQSFVNQLQMALFSWVKKNPAGDRPLGGLLVMDEAQTFAPSGSATPCTQSTLALSSQARKYGLGLVFATQAPKGLHNRITGNATTQFFGFLNSPVQIAAAKEMASAKGANVPDISRLTTGEFYVASDALPLQKIRTPMCLSYHPKSPLSQNEILELARGEVSESRPIIAAE